MEVLLKHVFGIHVIGKHVFRVFHVFAFDLEALLREDEIFARGVFEALMGVNGSEIESVHHEQQQLHSCEGWLCANF